MSKFNITHKSALAISILGLLSSQIIAIVPLVWATSPLEISSWYIGGTYKTYEEMIMVIIVYNRDLIDHSFILGLAASNGLFKGWAGSIVSASGIAKAGLNYYLTLILYPTEEGQVELQLILMTADEQTNNLVADSRNITIQKGDLETSVDNLQQYYASLNSSLYSSYNSLSSELANKYGSLETKYNSLQSESASTRILMYVTLTITVLFATATAYLALRKRTKNVKSVL